MIYIKKLRTAAIILAAVILFLIGITPTAAAADTTSAAGLVTTTSGALNVRSSASTAAAVIAKLPSGDYVTLISKSGSWWRIEYAPSCYGYASADYIKYIYGTYPVAASASVTVRSGPSVTYASTGTVPAGRTVLVLSQSDNWLRVIYNGAQSGYIPSQAITSLMAWPVPISYKINQYFGTHLGIDIGSSVHGVTGDAIIAAQQGMVVYSGWLKGYGYVVYINSIYNGQPIQTRYAHMNSMPLVTAGSTVGIGQKIGYMGSTGTSSGVHLHFEVRLRSSNTDCIANTDTTPVNPLDYVKSV
jgi:murein DD-endopeptidase MepM/ murein hydrolase activator NlpD